MLYSREEILSQIEITLASISGVMTCARDRGWLDEDQKPAIILLDGREDMVSTIVPQKTVKMPPSLIRLQPQIYLILPQRDDATNTTLKGQPQPVGPELSIWRDLILGALINDPTLLTMLTTTGQIVYRGMQTDMQAGRQMVGEMQLFIDFHYVWAPSQG